MFAVVVAVVVVVVVDVVVDVGHGIQGQQHKSHEVEGIEAKVANSASQIGIQIMLMMMMTLELLLPGQACLVWRRRSFSFPKFSTGSKLINCLCNDDSALGIREASILMMIFDSCCRRSRRSPPAPPAASSTPPSQL